jgi:poly(A) polymerase
MTSVANQDWFRAPDLIRVLAILNREGGEARVVGGAVRNSLMGLDVSDMDIATTLRPEAVLARAESEGIRCIPTGIKHGTVTLVVEGKPFEVTTLRHDVETDGRHAVVAFTDDWKADAERRDLTINALYADAKGEVHDYVGGIADVETATIRFIGEADQRIAEDYLRILRFFRFYAHYGRGRPDAAGLKACAAARGHLKTLSAERIWAELKKLLTAQDPFRALLWMRTCGVLTDILPETEKWGIDFVPGLVAAEKRFGWEVEPMVRLCAMVPPDGERLAALARRLKMSTAESVVLESFAGFPSIGETTTTLRLQKLLYINGSDGAVARLKLAMAKLVASGADTKETLQAIGHLSSLLSLAKKWEKPSLPIKGADLLASGMMPGPAMGEKLAALEALWIESGFKLTRSELLESV